MKKLWGGRFANEGCALLDEFNASIGFDHALYAQDIRGSLAHAQMLSECGIISDDDFREISRGLNQIKDEIENGKFEFKVADEDIHMAISVLILAASYIRRVLEMIKSRLIFVCLC